MNNYVTHSIATMAGKLRDDAGSIGLCSANGGFITKHAFGVYSTEPPSQPFQHADTQDEIDALPSRELAANYAGPATVEAYTVMHSAAGPEQALVSCRLDDGRRTWGTSTDGRTMEALMATEHIGTATELDADGVLHAA